jgi:hypothetical protein
MSETIIASNIHLSATNQGTSKEDETHKQKYGWSENGSDEGSLLVEMLQADGRRSIVDYESKICIFGRSVKLFGAIVVVFKTFGSCANDDKTLLVQLVPLSKQMGVPMVPYPTIFGAHVTFHPKTLYTSLLCNSSNYYMCNHTTLDIHLH